MSKPQRAFGRDGDGHPSPGYFSGEWTFRYTLRQAGWRILEERRSAISIAVALQAAPAAVSGFWTPVQQWEGALGSIRLLHAKDPRPATMLKPWDRCL